MIPTVIGSAIQSVQRRREQLIMEHLRSTINNQPFDPNNELGTLPNLPLSQNTRNILNARFNDTPNQVMQLQREIERLGRSPFEILTGAIGNLGGNNPIGALTTTQLWTDDLPAQRNSLETQQIRLRYRQEVIGDYLEHNRVREPNPYRSLRPLGEG